MQMICRRDDETGSAVTRRAGSGRPTRSARTAEKIEAVGELMPPFARSSENDVIFQRILNTWIVSKYVCDLNISDVIFMSESQLNYMFT